MPTLFKHIDILHQGETNGDWMILKLITPGNRLIYALAIPQAWASPTGPTWSYLFEEQGLTMIDAGGAGTYLYLQKLMSLIGFKISDIERLILTHGHWDHDGIASGVVHEGAELWAQELYGHLIPYHPKDLLASSDKETQAQLDKVLENDIKNSTRPSIYTQLPEHSEIINNYLSARKSLSVNKPIGPKTDFGNLDFIETPGHSPDHICISLDEILFTGDHILPEITPHPTMKTKYPNFIKQQLPKRFQEESNNWGLLVYIKSLKKIRRICKENVLILPAHRLYNRDNLNIITVERADEIINHHINRLYRIVNWIGLEPKTLEQITEKIFSRRRLVGGNLFPAFQEIVSHLELLIESEDVQPVNIKEFRWKGTDNFKYLINNILI